MLMFQQAGHATILHRLLEDFDPVKVYNSVFDKHVRQTLLDQMVAVYEDVMADDQVKTASV